MQPLLCPCCEEGTFSECDSFEICIICGWEDDPVQRADPAFSGGTNVENLNDARRRFKAGRGLKTSGLAKRPN